MSEIWQTFSNRDWRTALPTGSSVQRKWWRRIWQRIDAVNPALNAIVRVLADEARAAAVTADRKLAAGETIGPLHGVPFTVKENIDMAGLPTTWGVPALAQAVVPVDAPVVERMRAAGAIPIGRTNLPDMALRVHTDSSLHGLTRNPWHPGRTAGGSSGGEAAALASGMSPIGLGNDIGGSLRNPANACGIASIRPSAGRVPDAGYVPAEDRLLAVQLMNVQGPMARRVADVRLGLRVLMGAHPRDPWSIDAPLDGPPLAPADPRRGAGRAARRKHAIRRSPPRFAARRRRWPTPAMSWKKSARRATRTPSVAGRGLIMGDFDSVLAQLQPMMGADAVAFLTTANGAVPPLADAAAWSQPDGRARWRRARLVDLHGGSPTAAVADLDAAAVRAWLRFGDAERDRPRPWR